MKLRLNLNSITVQLVIIILLISIVPVAVLTYNTGNAIVDMKDTMFDQRLDNMAVIGDHIYQSRIDRDNTLASVMANDYTLGVALTSKDKLQVKRIVDHYARSYPDVSIVVVTNESGTEIASSSSSNLGRQLSNYFVDQALTGSGATGVDVVPAQMLKENYLEYKAVISGTADGLGIYCAQPVRDDGRRVIGAVLVVDLLNDNTLMVDQIAAESNGICTIFMGDVRIATTLRDERGMRLMGTRADPGLMAKALASDGYYRGYEDFGGQHVSLSFRPLKSPAGETVGMIAVGYDINPTVAGINSLMTLSIAIGLFIALASAVAGFFFVRRITRPISRLVRAADRVASGDLDAPLETGAHGGEIGELVSSIAKMVDSIKERINYNESVLKGIMDPMLVIDSEGRITFFNEPAAALTGYSLQEAFGKKYSAVLDVVPDRGSSIRDGIEKGQVVLGFEGAILRGDGKKAIVLGSSAPVVDAKGNNIGTIVLLRDVTKERGADDRIKASLKEKEVLLKEIHHRVKNNLQIISSLLSLQSAFIKDTGSLAMFRESQNRVKSMALIHERLYQSKDFSHIDFGEYVKKLSSFLAHTYGSSASHIHVAVDGDGISLGIDAAIPCGLIINELLTNAYKYAFPDGRGGEVTIGLGRLDGSGSYRLVVRDNGVGLPEDVDVRNTSTLGLQLVCTLIEQLGGTLAVSREAGTEYVITFSESRAGEAAG